MATLSDCNRINFFTFYRFFYKNFVEVDGLRLLQLFPTALRQN